MAYRADVPLDRRPQSPASECLESHPQPERLEVAGKLKMILRGIEPILRRALPKIVRNDAEGRFELIRLPHEGYPGLVWGVEPLVSVRRHRVCPIDSCE